MSGTPQPAPKPRKPTSPARIEANRRNALKSTGPKTPEGKARSAMNAVTHGLRCETVEPEHQRQLIDARLAEWAADLKPAGPAQAWLVRRAVAASVRLDLCLEAEAERRAAAAERAEATYLREARRKVAILATALPHRPVETAEALEATALGCEYLIDAFAAMARDLADADGYLGKVERDRALAMMGIDPRRPDPDHPVAGPFLRAALANECTPDPAEIDAWTGLDTKGLDAIARRIKQAAALPTEEQGRLQNLETITARMQELERLMGERYEEVEGPAIDEARRRAMLGSVGTKAAERLRRYEAGHSLDLHRSLNALAKLRKDAESRQAGAGEPEWTAGPAPAPNEPKPGPEAEPTDEPEPAGEAPAPNEPKPAAPSDPTLEMPRGSADSPAPASPPDPATGGHPDAATSGTIGA
jgi:hypothetical protein